MFTDRNKICSLVVVKNVKNKNVGEGAGGIDNCVIFQEMVKVKMVREECKGVVAGERFRLRHLQI